jgi:hypothetical protein
MEAIDRQPRRHVGSSNMRRSFGRGRAVNWPYCPGARRAPTLFRCAPARRFPRASALTPGSSPRLLPLIDVAFDSRPPTLQGRAATDSGQICPADLALWGQLWTQVPRASVRRCFAAGYRYDTSPPAGLPRSSHGYPRRTTAKATSCANSACRRFLHGNFRLPASNFLRLLSISARKRFLSGNRAGDKLAALLQNRQAETCEMDLAGCQLSHGRALASSASRSRVCGSGLRQGRGTAGASREAHCDQQQLLLLQPGDHCPAWPAPVSVQACLTRSSSFSWRSFTQGE